MPIQIRSRISSQPLGKSITNATPRTNFPRTTPRTATDSTEPHRNTSQPLRRCIRPAPCPPPPLSSRPPCTAVTRHQGFTRLPHSRTAPPKPPRLPNLRALTETKDSEERGSAIRRSRTQSRRPCLQSSALSSSLSLSSKTLLRLHKSAIAPPCSAPDPAFLGALPAGRPPRPVGFGASFVRPAVASFLRVGWWEHVSTVWYMVVEYDTCRSCRAREGATA